MAVHQDGGPATTGHAGKRTGVRRCAAGGGGPAAAGQAAAARAASVTHARVKWPLSGSCLRLCRRGFERLLRKLLRLRGRAGAAGAALVGAAALPRQLVERREDEMDMLASYYRLQVGLMLCVLAA